MDVMEYQSQLVRSRYGAVIKLCDRLDNVRHLRVEDVGEEFRVKQKVDTGENWLPWFSEHVGSLNPLLVELEELVKKS